MRSVPVLILLLLGSCAASRNRSERRPAPASVPTLTGAPRADAAVDAQEPTDDPAPPGGGVVARVGGEAVHASDLLQVWLHRDSPTVRDYIEDVVLSRLVLEEAQRLSIRLDPVELDAAVAAGLARLEADIEASGEKLGVDEFIRNRLGLDPEVYRERLRAEQEVDMLAALCVRAWLLESERAEVRLIITEDQDQLDEVRKRLSRGEDFAALARVFSVDDSAADGGRIPPVVRSTAALSRLAFATPVGDLGGPVFDQGRYLLIKVIERPEALAGGWPAIGAAVEASLDARPIEDPEYWQWKKAMVERYEVDLSPFLDLVGESPLEE